MNQLSVGISDFRANMSAVLQQVQTGHIIRLMHRGREVAKLVPPDYAQNAARQELAALRETAIIGDIVSPVNETWSAAE